MTLLKIYTMQMALEATTVVDKEHDLVIVTRWLNSNKLGELVRLVISSIEV